MRLDERTDTGDAKKELCLKLGAEKWVDFRESSDVIEDVKRATDGLGPKAAIITASVVRLLSSGIILTDVFMSSRLDPAVQSSSYVSRLYWDTGLSRNACRDGDVECAVRTFDGQGQFYLTLFSSGKILIFYTVLNRTFGLLHRPSGKLWSS